ncbi:hypothetical protein K7I13_07350 [Brucepastera parasyntrophica]|uniref:hypothetical protein n=1 Tax=Brucepastera parasyntrophica TaxID=2880008 RepID=UPI00210A4580|nr:hypothetical protein [Brucepastera parasyntrophica]ULQ61059.1 hypothetical protein K7I13_07350 [Brucepastera parasyntrophica]
MESKIDIQIGNFEQKKQIEKELITVFGQNLEYIPAVTKIIVPINFDETISNLSNKEYNSQRDNLNVEAVARGIKLDEEIILVISSGIFTSDFDNIIRSVYFLHERIHILNNRPGQKTFDHIGFLTNDTNWLYDEFLANHISWNTIINGFEKPIKSLELHYNHIIKQFEKDVKNISGYINRINSLQNEIINNHISFDNGFFKIKEILYDYLLKSIYIIALEMVKTNDKDMLVKKYAFPEPLRILFNEFFERIINYPIWFNNHSFLENIYNIFQIHFDNTGTTNEQISFCTKTGHYV